MVHGSILAATGHTARSSSFCFPDPSQLVLHSVVFVLVVHLLTPCCHLKPRAESSVPSPAQMLAPVGVTRLVVEMDSKQKVQLRPASTQATYVAALLEMRSHLDVA